MHKHGTSMSCFTYTCSNIDSSCSTPKIPRRYAAHQEYGHPQRTQKNDTIDATQNATTHHTNEKKIQKIVKQKDETNEKKNTDDLGSTGDESENGQSSNTHNDHDSDVPFENDTDEESDITVIEEEDWIEYLKKRSTDEAIKKDGKREDSMLEQDSQKNEMGTGAENSNNTE